MKTIIFLANIIVICIAVDLKVEESSRSLTKPSGKPLHIHADVPSIKPQFEYISAPVDEQSPKPQIDYISAKPQFDYISTPDQTLKPTYGYINRGQTGYQYINSYPNYKYNSYLYGSYPQYSYGSYPVMHEGGYQTAYQQILNNHVKLNQYPTIEQHKLPTENLPLTPITHSFQYPTQQYYYPFNGGLSYSYNYYPQLIPQLRSPYTPFYPFKK